MGDQSPGEKVGRPIAKVKSVVMALETRPDSPGVRVTRLCSSIYRREWEATEQGARTGVPIQLLLPLCSPVSVLSRPYTHSEIPPGGMAPGMARSQPLQGPCQLIATEVNQVYDI